MRFILDVHGTMLMIKDETGNVHRKSCRRGFVAWQKFCCLAENVLAQNYYISMQGNRIYNLV